MPVAVVGLRLAIPGLVGTLYSLFSNLQNDPSVSGRTSDYAVVLGLFDQHAILGRGLFTFVPRYYRILDNQYLMILVELGVVGLRPASSSSSSASSVLRRAAKHALLAAVTAPGAGPVGLDLGHVRRLRDLRRVGIPDGCRRHLPAGGPVRCRVAIDRRGAAGAACCRGRSDGVRRRQRACWHRPSSRGALRAVREGGPSMAADRSSRHDATMLVTVVSYNSADVLPGLIASLPAGMGDVPWQLVVADNASTDDSVPTILKHAPDARIVHMGRNARLRRGDQRCGRGSRQLLCRPGAEPGRPAAPRVRADPDGGPGGAGHGSCGSVADGWSWRADRLAATRAHTPEGIR